MTQWLKHETAENKKKTLGRNSTFNTFFSQFQRQATSLLTMVKFVREERFLKLLHQASQKKLLKNISPHHFSLFLKLRSVAQQKKNNLSSSLGLN